jgi:hypothetical protein
MGGDGTDFQAQAAQQELQKQRARDALNLQFGVAGSAPAPTLADFTKYTAGPTVTQDNPSGGDSQVAGPLIPIYDQAGYDAALAAWNNQGGEAAKNKAAREALYGTVRNDAFTAGKRGLDENKEKAGRNLKFTLFGQGLNGGSVDVDQNAQLGRTYNQGVLSLGAKADAAAADLRGNDETTRLGLLQSIDAGLDQGSALSSSLNQLKVNSDRAAAAGAGTTLGDLFADTGLLYDKSQAARGKTDAQTAWNSSYPSLTNKSSKGAGGIVSSTGG